MSGSEDSKVLILLLPDLFSASELRKMLEERCSHIENLGSLSKERLVGLFRKIIVPFPQRIYRSNRRGRMLIARRVKSGLEGRKLGDMEDEGPPNKMNCTKFFKTDRLKPPPNSNTPSKIRTGNCAAQSESQSDRNDGSRNRGSQDEPVKKVELKRQSSESRTCSESENKRRRTAIKWP